MQLLSAMINLGISKAVPLLIARFGTTEIMMILAVLFMLLLHIGIPVAVFFLIYRWWKKKNNKTE